MFIGDLCPICCMNKVLNQTGCIYSLVIPYCRTRRCITLIDKLNTNQQGSQFHICLDSFLSFGVLYKAICDWFGYFFDSNPWINLFSKVLTVIISGICCVMIFVSQWLVFAIRNTLFSPFERALKLSHLSLFVFILQKIRIGNFPFFKIGVPKVMEG